MCKSYWQGVARAQTNERGREKSMGNPMLEQSGVDVDTWEMQRWAGLVHSS